MGQIHSKYNQAHYYWANQHGIYTVLDKSKFIFLQTI
jgi:hypothetical protein